MPQFCAACGAQMADGATACPACGKSSATSAGGGAAAAPAASSGSNDNVIALLCYAGPVALIGIIMGILVEPYKNSKLCRFHAFQSLFLAIGMFVVMIGLMIIMGVLTFVFAPAALLGILLYPVIGLGMLGLCIFMMIKAYGGQMTKLPLVGNIAAKQAGV